MRLIWVCSRKITTMSFAEQPKGLPKKSARLHGMFPKNNARFARIVAETFASLGVTQSELAKRGGPSDTTLRKISSGENVGLSPRTLKGLDAAFQWTPGSAARTLAGGTPTPLTPEHPTPVEAADDEPDNGGANLLLDILGEILETAELPTQAQAQLQQLRDDTAIEQLPTLYAALTRPGKLRVANYGQTVWTEERGARRGLESDETTRASPEGGQAQEVSNGVEGGLYDVPLKEGGVVIPAAKDQRVRRAK